MIFAPLDATDDQLLSIIRVWIEALAREDYDSVFAELGYSLSFDKPGAECIRREIKNYRSPEYYPGIEDFVVSDWRTASGGNPKPLQLVRWYGPNDIQIRATVEVDLPLNGRWSDLEADFVFFGSKNPSEGYKLRLEQIGSSAQRQREIGSS